MSEETIYKSLSVLADHLEKAALEIREMLKELAPEKAIPRIDSDDLDKAGWLTYRTKVAAEPGTPAWLKNPAHFQGYEPPQVVLELVKAINKIPEKKLVLGDCEYSFSGNGKFISRRSLKVK